ncbi:hypothetical protein AU510_03115 [Lonsdalea britannica]|uniref:hypothetical protein n=1 Tax=Lonsdalea britannica TaxID=1082704 RepID=UPI000A1E2BD4|nr:hypothetical protein [Lonsdalea britannica]OSN08971.1 hypothetical protein AU510_03115 [Lonsdalea britannica]
MNIIDVATMINPELTPLDALQARYQWGERNHKIFSRFLKLESACLFPDASLPQLLKGSLEKLLRRHPDKRGQIRYLAYAHSLNSTFPFGADGLKNMAASLLPAQTEILSATQNSCASSFNALSLLASLLPGEHKEDGPRYAVLLTGEKCFHRTIQYANQNGIFGEGGTALLLAEDDTLPGCTVQGVGQAMIGGIGSRTYHSSPSLENRYDHDFMPTMMRAIHRALADAGIGADRLDGILPYHMSPITFDRIADQLNVPRDRVFRTHLYRLGHCFCGDGFINLHDCCFSPSAPRSGYFLAVAAGVAGTFGARVFHRQQERSPR